MIIRNCFLENKKGKLKNTMPAFHITVLGSSGGPLEDGTQSFMLKPADTLANDSNFICLDAGTGLSQLAKMIRDKKGSDPIGSMLKESVISFYERDSEPLGLFVDKRLPMIKGLPLLQEDTADKQTRNSMESAVSVFQRIREYYITHPHLDHLLALIVNTPLIFEHCEQHKTILGLPFTTRSIRTHIFNDFIWPNLIDSHGLLRVGELNHLVGHQSESIPDWQITPFQVNHGIGVSQQKENMSTAYLIHDTKNGKNLLICGDLESDQVSGSNSLSVLWQHLSQNVPLNNLKGIIIECSNTDSLKSELYGHMSPKWLVHELKQLKKWYGRPLDGLHLVIAHVKMSVASQDPRLVVLRQIRKRLTEEQIGDISVSIAIQGYTLVL